MKTLSLISQKGGVGKTTLSSCLAVAGIEDGRRVLVIDLDPQATASFWSDVRKDEEPAVMSIQPVRLPAVLKAAEDAGTDLVIIDGAAVSRDIAFQAVEVSDFVLVPFKAAVFDLNSVTQTVAIVRTTETPFSLVQTFTPPSGKEIAEAEEIASDLEVELAPVTIGNRKAFFRAQSEGKAVQEIEAGSKAAQEIKKLYTYTCIQLFGKKEAKARGRKLA